MVPRARTLPAAAREHELAARVKPKGREETRARQNARHQRRRQKKTLGPHFLVLPSLFCQTLGDCIFFLPCHIILGVANYNKWQTKNAKLLELL
jgi:hypothetical protein